MNDLKQNAQNNKDRNKVIDKYESSINKLQKAKDAKDNGDTSKMKQELNSINDKLDEITKT